MEILETILGVVVIICIIIVIAIVILLAVLFYGMSIAPDNCTACNGYPYACPTCSVFKANGTAAGDSPEELEAAIIAYHNNKNIEESGEFND